MGEMARSGNDAFRQLLIGPKVGLAEWSSPRLTMYVNRFGQCHPPLAGSEIGYGQGGIPNDVPLGD